MPPLPSSLMRLPLLAAAALLLAACQRDVLAPRPLAEIVDGAHNSGNQHFYFLPPMVKSPSYTGTFDPEVAPEVQVCEWSGTACAAIVAGFSMTTGEGSEIVRMEPDGELYTVNWHTDRYNLDAAKTYRIRVLVGTRELGHADVDVVTSGKELRNVNTNEYIALLDDRTLPIKFRVEEGAIPPEERGVVAGGDYHTCALAVGGAAYCWGYNGYGELGNGSYATSALPVPVVGGHVFTALTGGLYHTCGLAADSTAWCWGYGGTGTLGNGGFGSSATPVAVSGGHRFASLSAGAYHTCGLTDAGSVLCWGWNYYGQVGTGSFVQYYATPVAVASSAVFQSLDVGSRHSCAVTTALAAYCWGINSEGELGIGSTGNATAPVPVAGAHAFVSIDAGGFHSCALDGGGAAYCWGYNVQGQVGSGSVSTAPNGIYTPTAVSGAIAFTSLSLGGYHSCGLTVGGTAYCWGYNFYGQLGTGSFQQAAPYGTAYPVAVAGGDVWASLGAGGYHTCGVTVAGAGRCWGYNYYGELGSGGLTQVAPFGISVPGAVSGSLVLETP